MELTSDKPAIVVEGNDGVVRLAIAHQVNVGVGADEREEEAVLLHDGLTAADELDLAGRVDCGDLLGLHVQDYPV